MLAAIVVALTAVVIALGIALPLALRSRRAPARTMGCAEAWQAAAPSMTALGLRLLDAETYVGEKLFVVVHPREGTLRAWLHRAVPGGAMEAFLGVDAELTPGHAGRTPLARFVAGSVGELLSALPRGARLSIEAPDIPGDAYKATIHTPFPAPEVAAATARVLLALDDVARRPAPAYAQAALPRVAMLWREAAPSLEALGLRKLDAETYSGPLLFVTLVAKEERLRGWLHRVGPGSAVEAFVGLQAEIAPGEDGRSPLARFASGAVREVFARLPRGARLAVKAPAIPGDRYEATVTTPFVASGDAKAVAQVLLAFDEVARAPGGAQAPMPRIALLWREAGSSLEALGLRPMDAETYVGEKLFVTLAPREEVVRAWLHRVCPGGPLESFPGVDVELAPGDAGRSELERFVARAVREPLARLPRARLRVEAPDLAGDAYKATLTMPFTAPDQPALAASVLLALDEVARGRR